MTGRFAGNRCGERRVQGQGEWCCSFRGKKEWVADGMAGAGQRLAAAPPVAVAAPSIAGALWQVGTVCSHVSSLQLWVAGGDDFLRRVSAGFVLGGGKIHSWAEAKEWKKDSRGFISGPNTGERFTGVI